MDKADSDFLVLKELCDRVECDPDPSNAGWYIHRAYMLGQGYSVTDCLEFPPKRPNLTLMQGGKK